MSISKETAKKLHTGVKVATLAGSIGLCFTGVGTAVGLSGVAGCVADLAGGAVLSKGLDAASKAADKKIDKSTAKAKPESKTSLYPMNSRGQCLTPTLDLATDNLSKMQTDSEKNFQIDLAKAGVTKNDQMTNANELANSL